MVTAPLARLAQALATRRLSSVELTTALFDRIDTLNPRLNAFLALDRARALAQARVADARLAAGDA
ncbi:MAG TPA: Asp-tRNA(Asn)/Glu-tRNA(Gln) amidotransferase GatCAB subunit A, partial [Pseudomonadota bacterium]|nr:Asp-tRNA(Asn)/Glu-tRNA(Gln) amidotransferase GatCAB subunit A [Pseudomonadota bacterium]